MIKLNVQQPEKPVHPNVSDGQILEVNSMFATIQGEGPYAGSPSIFIRLAGCNLQCSGCDTEYTKRALRTVDNIYEEARVAMDVQSEADRNLHPNHWLIVITGGEPFRQNIVPLLRKFTEAEFDVQIETNGTLFPDEVVRFFKEFRNEVPGSQQLTIVCSPKTPQINKEIISEIDYYKYVVEWGHVDPLDGLPTRVLGDDVHVFRPSDLASLAAMRRIYVQPADTHEVDPQCNVNNRQQAVQSAMMFGYVVSLQQHKLLGVP